MDAAALCDACSGTDTGLPATSAAAAATLPDVVTHLMQPTLIMVRAKQSRLAHGIQTGCSLDHPPAHLYVDGLLPN